MTDQPDITNPKVFALYSILMIVFGLVIGIGCYITFTGFDFTGYKITPMIGVQVIIVMFTTGFIIAYTVRKIKERVNDAITYNLTVKDLVNDIIDDITVPVDEEEDDDE